MLRSFLTVFCIAVLPAYSLAATLDFRHSGGSTWGDSFFLGGVTVSAGTEVDGTVQSGNSQIATMRYHGLGIRGLDDTGLFDRTSQIDSYGSNDVVIFEFDRAVRLERVSFSGTEWWDRFDLYSGANLSFDTTLKVDDLTGYDWISNVGLGGGVVGTRFAIGASEYTSCGYSISQGQSCWTEDSSFHITSVSFSEIQPIPLPSSMALLLAGIAAVGSCVRCRRPITTERNRLIVS